MTDALFHIMSRAGLPAAMALLALCPSAYAAAEEDTGKNYVLHALFTEADTLGIPTRDHSIVTVEYLDELGRHVQNVSKWASPTGKDLCDYTELDAMGRIAREWMPQVGEEGLQGSFMPVPLYTHNAYHDSKPYQSYLYDAAPTPRLIETRSAGSSWQSHVGRRIAHGVNGTARNCRRFAVSDNAIVCLGDWHPGELEYTVATDEDGKQSITFVDKLGRTVMESKGIDTEAGTYYVYDTKGYCRYVLPPKLSATLTAYASGSIIPDSDEDMTDLAYVYHYDAQGRVVSKKMPGKAMEHIIYDRSGKPVLFQDGNLRQHNRWELKAYDGMGRVAYTAMVSLPGDVTSLRLRFRATSIRVDYMADGGYSDAVPEMSHDDILMISYYDSYDFIGHLGLESSLSYAPSQDYDSKFVCDSFPDLSARGMLTGTATRVLGDTVMLVRSLYYDHHGNVIQTHETNALGGTDHTYSHLSFTGKPLQVMHVHSTPDTTLTDVYSYTYDNMERLLTASVAHDGGTAVQLAANTYDELGRLASQQLGGTAAGLSEYAYNVRGWTTAISNPNFSQTLHYQDAFMGATPCYNGNISAMEWQARDAMMAATPTRHHYRYSYDGMNRLTAADHGATDAAAINGDLLLLNGQTPDYSCTYAYDPNGNVTALTRNGVNRAMSVMGYTAWQYGTIDDLSMTYDGNRLKKVTDQCADLTYEGAMDFRDGADQPSEYTYDADGNLTRDRNKGIHAIVYNVLDLPSRVEFNDGHIIRYRYAADGRKLHTEYVLSNFTVIDNPGSPLIPLSGGAQPMASGTFIPGDGLPDPENQLETTLMTRDYCGNVIYRDGALERIMSDYGYMDGTGNYHYFIKDYLGNVRAVIDGQGTLEEVNGYYPYGALLGGGAVGGNAGVQPYKYGTKELDRQNGLDWYDSQARMYDSLLGRTPTLDPLSEKYYPISPYAWCAGNPVRLVDPTGQFYTDNIKDDTIYPLIAFFPSERDEVLEIDYQVAREQNVPMFVVDNLNDFVDAMSCLSDMLGSTAMAIAINSHGRPGSFYIGETRIDGLTDLTDLKNILEGTEVFLGSCNTGTGIVGEQFTQHFSRETGTITVSSRHLICAGYRYNGGPELGGNGHPYINQFLGLDSENTFMVSEMGSKSNEVYNVRIDKNFGICWETGLYYEAVRPYTIINNLLKKGL